MSEFAPYKSHPKHQHSNMSGSSNSYSNCCSSDGETLCCDNNRCGHFFNQYRGPLIVIAIGIGFMAVGAIPVSIAMATQTKNSALVIGAGFIGFGLIIFVPGLLWCVVQRLLDCACCSKHCHCCTSQQQFPLQDDEEGYDDESEHNRGHHNAEVSPSCKYIPQDTLLNNVQASIGLPSPLDHHHSCDLPSDTTTDHSTIFITKDDAAIV